MSSNSNMKRGKSGGNHQNKPRRVNNRSLIPHPPPIKSYGITHDVRVRFQSGSAIDQVITFQNLLDVINISTSATTATGLFTQVRLNAVELWATPVTGAPVTISLIFSGVSAGAAGDLKLHTDTSMGIEAAHVKASPDRLTQAGQFQPNVTDTAFTLACPTGTVIDVSMSLRNAISGTATEVQNAPVGATAGVVYYRGLDGVAKSTTAMPVVGALATD
jgi:hypothetical protein